MYDVIIVGAGPCGLAAAAAAAEAGLEYRVLEKGCVVDALTRFPTQMRFFSTSDKMAIAGVPFITAAPNPTRAEAMAYYRQVAATLQLRINQYEEVIAIDREPPAGRNESPESDAMPVYTLTTRPTHAASAEPRRYRARNLVLATGYFDRPRLLGIPGESLPHVSHYFTEAHPYFRQRVLVVGGQNSAVEAALELHRAGADVTLVHRGPSLSPKVKPWVLPFIASLIEKGEVVAYFETRVTAIEPGNAIIERQGRRETLDADFVFLLTGYQADQTWLRRLGVAIDPDNHEPHYDPQTMETNVPGLFLAGTLAAGDDANRIFIENGRDHGPLIMQAILRRKQGA